jgi:hypothetical protein
MMVSISSMAVLVEAERSCVLSSMLLFTARNWRSCGSKACGGDVLDLLVSIFDSVILRPIIGSSLSATGWSGTDKGLCEDLPILRALRGGGRLRLICEAEAGPSSSMTTGVDLPVDAIEYVEPLCVSGFVISIGKGGKLCPIDVDDPIFRTSVLGRTFSILRIDVLEPFFFATCGVASPASTERTASLAGVSSALVPISRIAPLNSARKLIAVNSGSVLPGPQDPLR